ncbi:MAG: hypothetical protein NTW86_24495 [Candidatus Sumerlaeota bacterium]|nr:hypothetical protein [Candidatus Sumerlaeota bacterium]
MLPQPEQDPTPSNRRFSAAAADVGWVCLLLAAFYAWPLLAPGLNYRGGDPVLSAYPYRYLFRESVLRHGVVPLWNPYSGGGLPSLAAYQGACLYPPHGLFLIIPSIGFGCRLLLFLHYLLQGAGAYGLARFGLGVRRGAAVFAGVAVGASAFNAAHVEHFVIIESYSWIPLILWTWIEFLKRPGARRLAAPALCLACSILAGHSQSWLYALDAMGLLTVFPPVDAPWNGWAGAAKRRLTALGGLAAVGALALLLTAAQLLPTMEMAGYSERRRDPPDYGEASSFPPRFFLHYLLPGRLPRYDEPHDSETNPVEMAAFVGRVTVLLALVGLAGVVRRASTRALAVWALALAILATGKFGPFDGGLFRLAEHALPGWHGLRVPARLLGVANIALVLLAAQGLDRIGALRPRAASRFGVLAALCCLLALAEQIPVSARLPLRHPTPETEIPASASLQAWFKAHPGEHRVFQLTDIVDISRYDSLAGAAREALLEPNTSVYAGVGTLTSYVEGLTPLLGVEELLRLYRRNLYSPQPDARLLGLMNVRYLTADKPITADGWEWVDWAQPCEPDRRPVAIFQNTKFLPPVAWAADVEESPGSSMLDGPGDSGEALQPAPGRRPSAPRRDSPTPAIAIRRLSPNRLQVDKPAEAEGDLVFSTSAYPGWTAQWDGGAEPLRAQNALQLRFHAPGGVSRIDLVFDPFSFRLGLFLSLLAWSALAGARLTSGRARRYNEDE